MAGVLKLPVDALTRPARYHLAIIEAAMLFPHDARLRRAWQKAALSPSPTAFAKLQPKAQNPGKHGSILGRLIYEALVFAQAVPERAGLDRIRAEISDDLRDTYQIALQTMRNRSGPLHRLRPVAHLWAARHHFGGMDHHGIIGGEWRIPCHRERIGEFLSTAEAIRKQAETTRAAHAPVPILNPDESLVLSASVLERLPETAFIIRRL